MFNQKYPNNPEHDRVFEIKTWSLPGPVLFLKRGESIDKARRKLKKLYGIK